MNTPSSALLNPFPSQRAIVSVKLQSKCVRATRRVQQFYFSGDFISPDILFLKVLRHYDPLVDLRNVQNLWQQQQQQQQQNNLRDFEPLHNVFAVLINDGPRFIRVPKITT